MISLNESSLNQQYHAHHPILRDLMSIHRQGVTKLRLVYFKNQNFTIDIQRFKGTLELVP